MNMEQQRTEDGIWAYLHGALDEAARRDLEQRMAADPSLRGRCDQARRLDRLLRATLTEVGTGADTGDEALVEQALAAWERDQQAAHATPVAPSASRAARPRIHQSWAFRLGAVGLAAALLAVALLPVFQKPGAPPPAAWAPVAFAPLRTRGAPGAGTLQLQDAIRMQRALADSLSWALADRGGRLPDGLSLQFRVNELPAGALAVVVRAEGPDGRMLGEWSGDYSRQERFFEQADASAAQMAAALAVPPPGGPEPGPAGRKTGE
jgi:hypothetical protein